jgi:hypothetical protein
MEKAGNFLSKSGGLNFPAMGAILRSLPGENFSVLPKKNEFSIPRRKNYGFCSGSIFFIIIVKPISWNLLKILLEFVGTR